MITLSFSDTIKHLSFFSLLLLLGGCAGVMSAHDTSSCSLRGGKVQFKCTVWERDGITCRLHENICVGAMTHDEYKEQQQQELDEYKRQQGLRGPGKPAPPPPKLSKGENLKLWTEELDSNATQKKLTRYSHKYPKLSWLSSRWCLKGSGSKTPAIYFNIGQTYEESLKIQFSDIDFPRKRFVSTQFKYTHVKISGNYYNLWSKNMIFAGDRVVHEEEGRRLKKISDKEFALVYIFKGLRVPKPPNEAFMAREGQKVGPEQHIKNPKVYVKCE